MHNILFHEGSVYTGERYGLTQKECKNIPLDRKESCCIDMWRVFLLLEKCHE